MITQCRLLSSPTAEAVLIAHTTMHGQVISVIGNCGHSRLNLRMEKKFNPGTPVNSLW